MTRDPKNQGADGGFTLVELLVVVAVIGILSAIAIPTLAGHTDRAKVAAMRNALRNAATIEEALAAEDLPYATPDAAGLATLIAQGLRISESVLLSVVDDDMAAHGGGYCLKVRSLALDSNNEMWFASAGPDAGKPTYTPCLAS